jgi:hypothetical protein
MKVVTCSRCRESWSVLPDGTLVEHPQPACPALLCPGSRTKVASSGEGRGAQPARRLTAPPRQRERARFVALLEEVDRLQQTAAAPSR